MIEFFISIIAIITAIYVSAMLYLLYGLFRIPQHKNSRQHFISVVIAAHNEEDNIIGCLESIVRQDYSCELFEVIIANDRSTDNTAALVEEFCITHANVSIVHIEESRGVIPKKTALMKALERAQGEIIASTDADCVAPAAWLSEINRCFTEKVGMVIGHTQYPKPDSFWRGIDTVDYFAQRILGVAFTGVNSAYTCTASNLAYRKELYTINKEVFSGLAVRPAEDNFFLYCAHMHPLYEIAVATKPGSIITTKGAENLEHFLQQRFRWSAYGGNIITTGVKLFFIPVLMYYIIFWTAACAGLFLKPLLAGIGVSLLIKMAIDFLFLFRAAVLYKCYYVLVYFLPVFFIHLILIPTIVIAGNLLSFTWKGRRYTKENEITEN